MVAFPLLKLNEWQILYTSFLLTTSGWIKVRNVVAYEFIDELQYDECEKCIQRYETRKLAQSVEIVQDLALRSLYYYYYCYCCYQKMPTADALDHVRLLRATVLTLLNHCLTATPNVKLEAFIFSIDIQ